MSMGSKATTFCLFFLMLCLQGLFCWKQGEAKGNNNEPDYWDALTKALSYFEAQRSGRLPKDNRVRWRGNSALDDGLPEHVDLSGGYNDAGDNVKFNFPMAWTTTMLGWATIGHDMEMGNEVANARKAVRWGTAYLLKCATATKGRLYAGIAYPQADHDCWQRPEDMDGNRTVYYVNASNPGSDLAGETAAALAVGSIVFRHVDSNYSKVLLGTAREVYDFAYKYQGKYSDSLKDAACPYYCSYSGFKDELLWGAVWMYKATHEDKYYKIIKDMGYEDQPDIFSWDNKLPGAYILLARYAVIANDTKFEDYKKVAESFLCKIYPNISTSTTKYTPGGLMYKLTWANLQYVASISFLFVSYTNYMVLGNANRINCADDIILTRHQLRKFAKTQVDYILGNNSMNMSYMVGYGNNYPKRPHHRASSLPPIQTHPEPIACKDGFRYLDAPGDNPNILNGAIVGGPDENDTYKDDRRDYMHSEPATYITAPIVGSLAAFTNN